MEADEPAAENNVLEMHEGGELEEDEADNKTIDTTAAAPQEDDPVARQNTGDISNGRHAQTYLRL